MITLATHGVLGDNLKKAVDATCKQSGFLCAAFFVFMLLSAITLYNMLLGVLCEVITRTTEEEKQAMLIEHFKANMLAAFEAIDHTSDGYISREEWQDISQSDAIMSSLEELGIERKNIHEKLKTLDELLFGPLEDDETGAESNASTPKQGAVSSETDTDRMDTEESAEREFARMST